MPNTTISIEVSLNEAQISQLLNLADLPPDQKAKAVLGLTQGALEDLAAGGSMLSPAAIARLRGSLDNPYDEDSIVAAVEAAHRKSGDSHVISYVIDPSYVVPLEDVAKSQGIDLVSLVQQCIGQAFEMGWFYEMNLNQRSVPFSQEQYDAIRTRIGKDVVFGTDIADFISAAFTPDMVRGNNPSAFDRIAAELGPVDPTLKALADITRANAEDGERPTDTQTIDPRTLESEHPLVVEEEAPLFAAV